MKRTEKQQNRIIVSSQFPPLSIMSRRRKIRRRDSERKSETRKVKENKKAEKEARKRTDEEETKD